MNTRIVYIVLNDGNYLEIGNVPFEDTLDLGLFFHNILPEGTLNNVTISPNDDPGAVILTTTEN